jgi:prepilin-type N-terminal cleavage/methylation domain-containing protein
MAGTRPTRRNFTRHGFTLIELLIVIAVIALIAAILFPVFARARENARRAGCQSNMKQMGLAFTQYTQDYDERYPIKYWACGGATGIACPYTDSSGTLWYHALFPYTKSVQIFNCPSAAIAKQSLDSNGKWVYTTSVNYGWNESYGSLPGTTTKTTEDMFSKRALADVADPGGTLLVTEADQADDGNSYHINGTDSSSAKKPGQLHFEGDNVLFADGHVKWMKQSLLLYPYSQYKTPPGIWTLKAED